MEETGRGAGISPLPAPPRPGKRDSGAAIKRTASARAAVLPLAMPATSDAGSDPEAARPPATSARACHPLPWALSAALLLLAAACAYCALRAWAPGAPGPGPPPDAQPPASLELPPDAGARLPAASQVRRSPTWAPGSPLHPTSPEDPPSVPPAAGSPPRLSDARGHPFFIQDVGGHRFIADPENTAFYTSDNGGDSHFLFWLPENLGFLPGVRVPRMSSQGLLERTSFLS